MPKGTQPARGVTSMLLALGFEPYRTKSVKAELEVRPRMMARGGIQKSSQGAVESRHGKKSFH